MKCDYVDHLGDDLRVVNAARVSFAKESDYDLHGVTMEGPRVELKTKDKKLISYLASHGHWTPFSHCIVTLRETVPIVVARQRFKHFIGFTYAEIEEDGLEAAYNETSRRYVSDTPEFYRPENWYEKPDGSIKQGRSQRVVTELELDEHLVWDDRSSPKLTSPIKAEYEAYLKWGQELYELMIKSDVAPEQARMVLPQSMYTSYYVTGSLAAFARAYNLRSKSDAQMEIQELAKQWNEIISPLFPISWAALTRNKSDNG